MVHPSTLRRLLHTVLRSVDGSAPPLLSTGGVVAHLPLPSLRVNSELSIPLALNRESIDTLRRTGTNSGGHVTLDATHIDVSPAWNKAVASLVEGHLTEMQVLGVPVHLKLRDLIVVSNTTWISPSVPVATASSTAAFASIFVQLPGDTGGYGFVVEGGETKSRQEYDLTADSTAFFYAVTLLSGCKVTFAGNKNPVVYLRYDIYCSDNGPLPSVTDEASRAWALKRAVNLWKNMPADDKTTPKKLAIMLDHRAALSFDMLPPKDAALVDAIKSVGEFTFFLVETHKPQRFNIDFDNELITGGWALNKTEDGFSRITTRRWLDEGSESNILDYSDKVINDGDALLPSDTTTFSFWNTRALLVFWPYKYDSYMARQVNSAIAARIAKKALLRSSPESLTTVNAILDNLHFYHESNSALMEFIGIAADVGNIGLCKRLLKRNQHGLTFDLISPLQRTIKSLGWDGIKNEVVSMIRGTGHSMLKHAADLACKLLFDDSNSKAASDITSIVVKTLLEAMENTMRGFKFRSNPQCYGRIMQLLFSLESLDGDLVRFSAAASRLYNSDLLQVVRSMQEVPIKYRHRSYQHAFVSAYFSDPPVHNEQFLATSVMLLREMGWTSVRECVLAGVKIQEFDHCHHYGMLVHLLFTDQATNTAAIEIVCCIVHTFVERAISKGGSMMASIPHTIVQALCFYPGLSKPKAELVSVSSELSVRLLGVLISRVLSITASGADSQFIEKLLRTYVSRFGEISSDPNTLLSIWEKLLRSPGIPRSIHRMVADAIISDSNNQLLDMVTHTRLKTHMENPELLRLVRFRFEQLEKNKDQEPPASISYEIKDALHQDTGITDFLRSDRRHMRVARFSRITYARSFAEEINSINLTMSSPISIRAEPGGRGQGSYVAIYKEHRESEKQLSQFHSDKRRLVELKQLLEEAKKPSSSSKKRPGPIEEDDVVFVDVIKKGNNASIDLPHTRNQCGVHPFEGDLSAKSLHCDKCFCYVCDVPASECKSWKIHCIADEKAEIWREIRKELKNINSPPTKRLRIS